MDPSSRVCYSVATDTYALTLTFYELLTSQRPYAHRGVYDLSGEDQLVELFVCKHQGVDPIDERAVHKVLDLKAAESVLEVLRAGLNPDPEKRASLQTLLSLCRQHFEVSERRKKDAGEYVFDAGKGLVLWQNRFPRLSAKDLEQLQKGSG